MPQVWWLESLRETLSSRRQFCQAEEEDSEEIAAAEVQEEVALLNMETAKGKQ